jgi:hypothetical protein
MRGEADILLPPGEQETINHSRYGGKLNRTYEKCNCCSIKFKSRHYGALH